MSPRSSSSAVGPEKRTSPFSMKYARGRRRERDVHRLLDEDDRAALRVDLAHDVEQLLDDRRRQAERQLVDDQQLRLGDERHAERELLLLAAGQVAGQLVPALAQPREAVEHLARCGASTSVGSSLANSQVPGLEVLGDGEGREDGLAARHLHDAHAWRSSTASAWVMSLAVEEDRAADRRRRARRWP